MPTPEQERITSLERQMERVASENARLRRRIDQTYSQLRDMIADPHPVADEQGLWTRCAETISAEPTHHFRTGAIPSGFAWAGAPFTTPGTIFWNTRNTYGAFLQASGGRHFLYDSISTYLGRRLYARLSLANNGCIGLRVDDGTDDNYYECYFWSDGAGEVDVRTKTRLGGGVASEATALTTANVGMFTLHMFSYNPTGSQHFPHWYFEHETGAAAFIANVPFVLWTASRVGLVMGETHTGSAWVYCDWFYSTYS